MRLFLSKFLTKTGNYAILMIVSIANAIGDSIDNDRSEIGVVVDVLKEVAAGATNTIVDAGTALYEGGKNLWNKLFG